MICVVQFIHVKSSMDVTKLVSVMLKQWNMEQPNLLISVTGGAKDFTLKPGLMDVFRHGLVKAAESTGILMSLYEISYYCLFVGLNLSDVNLLKIMSIYKLSANMGYVACT